MSLRSPLWFLLISLLAGCVTTGDVNPLKTEKGREEARDAYIQLGIGYLRQGATERAKPPLKKALELDPNNADANVALAMVFQIEMEPELAEKYYRKAISESGDSSRIYNNYAGFLYEQKRYPEAHDFFTKAASDNMYPERSRVFENLGLTALKMAQPDKAKHYFEKALRLNPNQATSLLEIAMLEFESQQYVPARDHFEKFNKRGETSASSLLLGIRLAVVFEDRDTAASYGLQLRRLYPGSPEYQQYLLEKK